MRILVVEDHPKIRANIIEFAKIQTITADGAFNGEEWLQKALVSDYDVIVLDINLPVLDGRGFLKKFRAEWKTTPVLALTSNSLLEDKLDTFDLGADDYLTKPFEFEELFARIRALSKRKNQDTQNVVTFGDVEVDPIRMSVKKAGKPLALSGKEIRVLAFLAENYGVPKNKTEIFEHVWWESGETLDFDSITLEVHIANVRKKIGKNYIKTIRSVGYILSE